MPFVNDSKCSSSQETSTNLTLSWQNATSYLPLSYEIRYDPKGGTIQTDSPRIPINNLVPGTSYSFTILVFIKGNPDARSHANITCTGSTGMQTVFYMSFKAIAFSLHVPSSLVCSGTYYLTFVMDLKCQLF